MQLSGNYQLSFLPHYTQVSYMARSPAAFMLTDVKYFSLWKHDHKMESFNGYIWICKFEILVLMSRQNTFISFNFWIPWFQMLKKQMQSCHLTSQIPATHRVSPGAQNYPLCSLPGLLSHIWCQAKSKPRLGTVEHLILLWPEETPLTFQVKQVQNLSQVMPFAVKTLCHFFIGYNYAQDNRVGTVMWSNKGSANCSLLCTAEAFTN